jgi:hypothetical protein
MVSSRITPLSCFGSDFPFEYHGWIDAPDGLGSIPDAAKGQEVAVVGTGTHTSNPGPGDVWDERGPTVRADRC